MTAIAQSGFFGSDVAAQELCDLGADMNRKGTGYPYTALRLANDRYNANITTKNYKETVQVIKACGGHLWESFLYLSLWLRTPRKSSKSFHKYKILSTTILFLVAKIGLYNILLNFVDFISKGPSLDPASTVEA